MSREVTLLQFEGWPDLDVPEMLINLLATKRYCASGDARHPVGHSTGEGSEKDSHNNGGADPSPRVSTPQAAIDELA